MNDHFSAFTIMFFSVLIFSTIAFPISFFSEIVTLLPRFTSLNSLI